MCEETVNITTADFERSAQSPQQFFRDGIPEIAFAGRSNVGKSTLLNRLLNRNGLARTSNTPGRTQSINYFLINRRLRFVDLPGYGYAKASKDARRQWAQLMEVYLRRPMDTPVLLVQLIDGKVGATDLDFEAHHYFDSLDLPSLKVATKVDKVPRSKRVRHLKSIRQRLELSESVELVAFSAVSGDGIGQLWRGITAFLDDCREERLAEKT